MCRCAWNFEHVYVFWTVAEAVSWAGGFGGDSGRGRNKRGWARIVRIDPLAPDDPIDPRRITCIHKESSPFHQRLEARRQIKCMMREASPLVQLARRFSKRAFSKYHVTPDRRNAIRAYTELVRKHSGGMCAAEYQFLQCKVTSFHEELKMLIHGVVMGSRVNGPGLRAVIYFQGCTLVCRNCWNPETHSFSGAERSCDLNHKMAPSAILWFLTATRHAQHFSGMAVTRH